jgi:hypothetical protein
MVSPDTPSAASGSTARYQRVAASMMMWRIV